MHSFRIFVGMGSSGQDFVGGYMIIILRVSEEIGGKKTSV